MAIQFNPSPRLTWVGYWAAYLRWMQKVNHPDLAKSNYHADKFREERKSSRVIFSSSFSSRYSV